MGLTVLTFSTNFASKNSTVSFTINTQYNTSTMHSTQYIIVIVEFFDYIHDIGQSSSLFIVISDTGYHKSEFECQR